ncbi:MAG: Trp biosynthesis associated, transrane protein Oprn/Chp [Frankiales bacterium]|nr:Trp biosynthesis associated, transrane protein Oprn/Chp [Frankiales bacterium]
MTAKRELQLAVLLCLLGSAVVLLALGQAWFTVEEGRQVTIDAVRTSVNGAKLASGAQALGYVGLAGVVALAATKRWGRLVVGVLVLAAGVGIVVDVATALSDGLERRGLSVACAGGARNCVGAVSSSQPGWGWLTLAGGVVLALSGLLVAVRGRRWAALSSSYDVPAARAEQPPATDKGVWDALDRGEDPTS